MKINKKSNRLLRQFAVAVLTFIGIGIIFKYWNAHYYGRIAKNKYISKAFSIRIYGPDRQNWYGVEYNFLFRGKSIKKSQPLSLSEKNTYRDFIKDSAWVVIDSTNTIFFDLIFKPSQFKKYNLDTTDVFYKGLFDLPDINMPHKSL